MHDQSSCPVAGNKVTRDNSLSMNIYISQHSYSGNIYIIIHKQFTKFNTCITEVLSMEDNIRVMYQTVLVIEQNKSSVTIRHYINNFRGQYW